jgi:hypothetical protein
MSPILDRLVVKNPGGTAQPITLGTAAAGKTSAGTAGADIIIKCEGRNTEIGGERTDAPIDPSLGYGGHPVAVRPKKSALTVFEGRQPFQMTMPLLFSGSEVYLQCFLLDQMASTKLPTANLAQPVAPYSVKIESTIGRLLLPGGIQKDDEWWIEDLAWGAEKRNTVNELYYKEVVVTLLEKVVDETLKGKGWKAAHPYTVRRGDTWAGIAARELGDAGRFAELMEINGEKTNAQLAKMVGKTIRIPEHL